MRKEKMQITFTFNQAEAVYKWATGKEMAMNLPFEDAVHEACRIKGVGQVKDFLDNK